VLLGGRSGCIDGYHAPCRYGGKIAAALGLSVEYLVTGKEYKQNIEISGYLQFRDILDDFAILPDAHKSDDKGRRG